MKEAIVSKGPVVKIVDSEIPKPNADQVVIKVVVSGSNPKDVCHPLSWPFFVVAIGTNSFTVEIHRMGGIGDEHG